LKIDLPLGQIEAQFMWLKVVTSEVTKKMMDWWIVIAFFGLTGTTAVEVQQITRTQDLPGADTLNVRPEFFDDIQDVSLISDTMAAYVTRACPSGIERCECMNAPGTFSKGPFNPKEDLLGSIFAHLGCNPSHCFCKDDNTTAVDIRPQYFKAFMNLCPKNELNRCLCQDGKTTEKAPFDILKTINCRPKKCKCNGNNKVKVVQEFGCEKGGYPICNEKEPGVFNLACKDGTRLTFPFILQWNLDTLADQWRLGKDFKGCLCPDGIMPRCQKTKKLFECPNGEPVNFDKFRGYIEYNGCKMEDW